MFETVHLDARTDGDGHLRVDLPLNLPPGTEVTVTIILPTPALLDENADAE